MKLQRVSALSSKSLKTIIRQPAALFMTILFPLVMTLVFGASFGGIGGAQETTFKMGVVNLDLGGNHSHWSADFIGNMSQTGILDVRAYPDNATGQHDLSEGSIQGLILIPDNFGESCDSFWKDPANPSVWVNATVELYVDSASMLAVQAVPPVVQDVLANAVYSRQISVPRPVQLGIPSLVEARKFTTYDYFVPGLFAFAAIFLIMIVAQSFTLDRQNGLLRRLATTPVTSSEVIGAEAVTYMVVAVVQVGVVFAMAFLMGFRPVGSLAGIFMAFILVLVFALCSVGFGLISASLAKDPGTATGIAFIFIMPLMFLGTFVGFAMSAAMKAIEWLVPSWYVTDALTDLFLRGAKITSLSVLTDLAIVCLWSVAILGVGVLLFGRYGKR